MHSFIQYITDYMNYVLEVRYFYLIIADIGRWYCCWIVRRMSALCLYIIVGCVNDFLIDGATLCGCSVGVQFQMLDYDCTVYGCFIDMLMICLPSSTVTFFGELIYINGLFY
jgi:hypothetical protein